MRALIGAIISIILINCISVCNNPSQRNSPESNTKLCDATHLAPSRATLVRIDSLTAEGSGIDTTCLLMAVQYLVENGNFRTALNLSEQLSNEEWTTWLRKIDIYNGLGNLDSASHYGHKWLLYTKNTNSADSALALELIAFSMEKAFHFESALGYRLRAASAYSLHRRYDWQLDNARFGVFIDYVRIGKPEKGEAYLKEFAPHILDNIQMGKNPIDFSPWLKTRDTP